MGELAQQGDKKLVQERLCYSRQGFDAVIKRMEDQTVYGLLDPGREERSDALSVDQLLLHRTPTLGLNLGLNPPHKIPGLNLGLNRRF